MDMQDSKLFVLSVFKVANKHVFCLNKYIYLHLKKKGVAAILRYVNLSINQISIDLKVHVHTTEQQFS